MSEVESNSTNSAEVYAVVKDTTLQAAKELMCASTEKAASVKENPASSSTVNSVIASYDDAPLVVKEAIDGYNGALLVVDYLVSKHSVDLPVVKDQISKHDVGVLIPCVLIPSAIEKMIGRRVIEAYANAILASRHLLSTYNDALLVATEVYNDSTNNVPQAVIIGYNDALLVVKKHMAEYIDVLLLVSRALDAMGSEVRSLEEQAPIKMSVVVEKIVDMFKVVMDAYKNALALSKNLMLACKDAFLLIKKITGSSANEPRLTKGQKRIREEAGLGKQKKLCAKPCRDCPDKKESNLVN